MNKRDEERILAEIRRRVLARDESLRRRLEMDRGLDATQEALAELTTLSPEEVERIAREVRAEDRKRRSRRRSAGIFLALLLFGALAGLAKHRLFPPPDIAFDEPFDDDANGWAVGDDFTYRRILSDGRYRFETRRSGWCFFDDIPLDIPDRFSAELETVWEGGKYEEFGLMLMASKEDHLTLQMRGDGAASHARKRNDEWVDRGTWATGFPPSEPDRHRLRVEIADGRWRAVANGRPHREGDLDGLAIRRIGLRSCGRQTIAFARLRVETPGAEHPLLNEDFRDAANGWSPATDLKRSRRFENGRYLYASHVGNMCYWASIRRPLTGDFSATLHSVWLRGEEENYGFMLQESGERFLAFEMRSDGSARTLRSEDGKFTGISPYRPLARPGDGETGNTQEVRVRKGRFEYLVNGAKVADGVVGDLDLSMIGVRVCGKQAVAFDHLSIRSIR